MIEILPMSEKEEEQKILQKAGIKENNARVLKMTESDSTIGWVAVNIVDKTLNMLHFFVVETSSGFERGFYLDTLMRSAASYGETNNADKLSCSDIDMIAFLKSKGFDADDTHAYAPMSLIVHYE